MQIKKQQVYHYFREDDKMKKAAFISMLTMLSVFGSYLSVQAEALTEIDTSVSIQGGMRIAVVSKKTKGQFWNMLHEGMNAAVAAINEAYGLKKDEKVTLTFEGPANEQLVEEQINILDAVLAENPDVLCISAGDMQSCQAQLEVARENGIPVVVFDSNVVDKDLVTAFRATDNLEVGHLAAQELAEALQEKGNILVFSEQQKTESIMNRMKGFREVIDTYPEIEIVEEHYADEEEDFKGAMEEALRNNPDTDGVFCTNADSAEIYLSIEAGLREGISMVGVDATSVQQQAIKNGEEVCTISQDPKTLGYETIITAVYAAMHDNENITIARNVLLQPRIISAANIYNPQNVNYLYSE